MEKLIESSKTKSIETYITSDGTLWRIPSVFNQRLNGHRPLSIEFLEFPFNVNWHLIFLFTGLISLSLSRVILLLRCIAYQNKFISIVYFSLSTFFIRSQVSKVFLISYVILKPALIRVYNFISNLISISIK